MVSPDSEAIVSADTAAGADVDTEDRSDVESDVTVEADTKEAEVSTPAAASDEDTDLSNVNQGDNVKFVTTACGDQVSGGDDGDDDEANDDNDDDVAAQPRYRHPRPRLLSAQPAEPGHGAAGAAAAQGHAGRLRQGGGQQKYLVSSKNIWLFTGALHAADRARAGVHLGRRHPGPAGPRQPRQRGQAEVSHKWTVELSFQLPISCLLIA